MQAKFNARDPPSTDTHDGMSPFQRNTPQRHYTWPDESPMAFTELAILWDILHMKVPSPRLAQNTSLSCTHKYTNVGWDASTSQPNTQSSYSSYLQYYIAYQLFPSQPCRHWLTCAKHLKQTQKSANYQHTLVTDTYRAPLHKHRNQQKPSDPSLFPTRHHFPVSTQSDTMHTTYRTQLHFTLLLPGQHKIWHWHSQHNPFSHASTTASRDQSTLPLPCKIQLTTAPNRPATFHTQLTSTCLPHRMCTIPVNTHTPVHICQPWLGFQSCHQTQITDGPW